MRLFSMGLLVEGTDKLTIVASHYAL